MTAAKIIYGTAWKKERTTALVVSAVLNGFRAIDTAAQPKHYREDLVGEALRELQEKHGIKREDLWIQTKFTQLLGQDRSLPLPYRPNEGIKNQLLSSVEQSLGVLGVAYLDSVLMHSPCKSASDTEAAFRALVELQDAGKVKHIGMSNTYDVAILEAIERACGKRVQIVQNRWHEGNHWDRGVARYCRENGIQYQSFWTLSGSPRLLAHPSLQTIANAKNCTPEQALFRLAQLHGITPLSGTTNEQHMREDVAVQDIDLENHLDAASNDEVSVAVRDVARLVWGL
ncbi:NADP-dependent oxidoreductase domain-containing protein [Amylocystis lapponica]|nr:NADP-dependent oxidoreductase domain-containing protein [Amylocystis lapponica]